MLWRQGTSPPVRELGVHSQRSRPAHERRRTSPGGAPPTATTPLLVSRARPSPAIRAARASTARSRTHSTVLGTGCRARRRSRRSRRPAIATTPTTNSAPIATTPTATRPAPTATRSPTTSRTGSSRRTVALSRIVYDCDGNRVAKTVGGVTTKYLVDDLNPTGYLQVLEEVVGGAVQTRYTYGTSIVSQTRNVSSTPATSYYGYDAHGNVTFLTDASGSRDGLPTTTMRGGFWSRSSGSTPNTRFYVGEELDPDLGLINLRARQYRPETGRFLTIDPLSCRPPADHKAHRYLYGGADPANLLDPSGLTPTGEYVGGAKYSEVVQQEFLLLLDKRIQQLIYASWKPMIGVADPLPAMPPDDTRAIWEMCKACFAGWGLPARVRFASCLGCAAGIGANALKFIPKL